jgi:hypothetical protein
MMLVAKLGSLPTALASSDSVSSAADKLPPAILEILELTYDSVAMTLVSYLG